MSNAVNSTPAQMQGGAVAQPQASGLKAFNQVLTSPKTQEYLSQVLGKNAQSFVNNVTALVANSATLQRCAPMGVMYSAIKATALNLPLDPNLGFAYVIPYENRRQGVVEAQFQIGYKGFIQLAIRSGQFKAINATEVKEGELQDFDLLTGGLRFEAKPNRHELPTAGYVAYFELINGFSKSLYMTKGEVEAHRQRFSKARNSPWDTDFDAMAKKTVLKLLLSRYAPLSVELIEAVKNDQATYTPEGQIVYIDNPRNTSTEEAVAIEIEAEANKVAFDPSRGAEDAQAEEVAQGVAPTPEAVQAQSAPTPQAEAQATATPQTLNIPEIGDVPF